MTKLHDEKYKMLSKKMEYDGMGKSTSLKVTVVLEKAGNQISIKSSSATEAEILSTALITADESEQEKILAHFRAIEAKGIIYDREGKAIIENLT